MKTHLQNINAKGIRFSICKNELEIARAYLYLMHNDLHRNPFGLLEDVFVDENYRGQGIGTQLVREVIETAKKQYCYKLIATSRTSRSRVHQLYRELGFVEHGIEFRIDLF